jgi:WD40 repeat protein
LAFSADGKRLVSSSRDNTVKVWDAATGEIIHSLPGQPGAVLSVRSSPEGKRLASYSDDGTITIRDASIMAPPPQ